jgi:hypothetical protein
MDPGRKWITGLDGMAPHGDRGIEFVDIRCAEVLRFVHGTQHRGG